jgi:hypothetical protein
MLNIFRFVHISHERKAEKYHLTPFLFFINFTFLFVSRRQWHLIRTFGSSGGSVLAQGFRTDCHQVPTAALCLVPWHFQWIDVPGTSPEEQTEVWDWSLSEQFGRISVYMLMSKAIYFFLFLTCCESAIHNIRVQPSWTSWYPLLGCISRIVLFESSDHSMFSFLKNLQAIFQNDVFRFILTSSVPRLHSCSILVLSNTCYPPTSSCGWKVWFSRRTVVWPEDFILAYQALYPLRNATSPDCCGCFGGVFSWILCQSWPQDPPYHSLSKS